MSKLRIDKSRLDEELISIPVDTNESSVRLANAKASVDAISAELELAQARLSAAIRQNPEEYGLVGKATVDSIAGAVLMDSAIQAIAERLRGAKHAVDLSWAVVNGLTAKRESIQPLVKLFLSGYYSNPTTGEVDEAKAASEAVQEAEQVAAMQPTSKAKPPAAKQKSKAKAEPINEPATGSEDLPNGEDW